MIFLTRVLVILVLYGGFVVSPYTPLANAQSSASQSVPVIVESDNGYARLVFRWQDVGNLVQPPVHSVNAENGVLLITFDYNFTIDLDALLEQTSDYIALVRQDDNGRTLRLALKYPFRIESNVSEMDVAIDLLPESFVGTPQAHRAPSPAIDLDSLAVVAEKRHVPTAAELRRMQVAPKPLPLDAPRLPVRVVRNDGRSRIIFQWPEKVGYDITREEDTIVLNFNQIARPKLTRLRVDPPRLVRTAEAVKRLGGLEVLVEVDPNADFHHFRDENDIVVDIVPASPKAKTDEQQVASLDSAHGQSPTSGSEDDENHGESSVDKAAVAGDETHESAPAEPEALASSEAHRAEPAAAPEHGTVHVSEAVDAQSVEHTDDHNVQAEPETQILHEYDEKTAHQPEETASKAAHPAPAFANSGEVEVEIIETADGVEVLFPWGKDVAAAIFRRGDYLWAIFDASGHLDLTAFDRGHHYELGDIVDFSTDDLTFVRLSLGPRSLVSVKPEHHAWRIFLGETAFGGTQNIKLVPNVETRGEAHITADLPSANTVHHVTDPEVGDDITVVTALGPAQGLIAARKYIDFMAMASAHGLAIQKVDEDLNVSIHDGIVTISKPRGLELTGASSNSVDSGMELGTLAAVSAPSSANIKPVSFEEEVSHPGIVRFEEWAGTPDEGFHTTHSRLNNALARAPRRERSERRLALARFYFAYGLLSESIGALNLIAQEDPGFSNVAAFVSLKGATQQRMLRNKEAMETLSHFSVKDDPGAAIWRAQALEGLGFHSKARIEFASAMKKDEEYPLEWRARFMLSETKAALGVGDLEDANSMWENIPLHVLSDTEKAEAYLIKGKILNAIGEPALALDYFRKIYPLTVDEMAHRARFRETEMLYKVGELKPDEAIERLERLRFQWRGDDLELHVIRELGEIYLDQGQYRDALSVMKVGVTFKSGDPISRDMYDRMDETFRELYLEGKADSMKPAAAISLFYDFKELTPIGSKGDRMIRLLSERLVTIGLLDQAAELLSHQVKYRLTGTARAQVAMRLALIQLRNKRPEEAFRAISTTRFAGLTPKLRGQRRLIEARAMADMGRHSHAIEILEDDVSREAEVLRANIFWDSDNWPETGRIYEEILENEWGGDETLSNEKRVSVMRMAIAYALVEDRKSLDRIRRKFGAQMAATSDAQAFNIATGDMALQGVAFRDVLRRVNSIDTFEAFMSDFKTRFGDEGTMVN